MGDDSDSHLADADKQTEDIMARAAAFCSKKRQGKYHVCSNYTEGNNITQGLTKACTTASRAAHVPLFNESA
jgi:hypothetical protein